MIAGTGIDIIEVERVGAKVRKENGFKEKVFSPAEIAYCESNTYSDQHYATRFAAKEAFLKATGKGLVAGHDLFDIEVTQTSSGKPEIVLRGNFRQLAVENGWKKIHLSLAHVQSMACAVVIIEQ